MIAPELRAVRRAELRVTGPHLYLEKMGGAS